MHTSSDCIAHLAGALAKAQVELVNPPKSCRAVLEPGLGGSDSRTFHYAPLSAGLDIVRKTLGKHDIAVVQATEVDRESGTVILTTTLAHGSGQWIAAQWPVCRVADMAQPKLMGAALTYARRYGLFTLVGIAGEDDLDAVDLPPGQRSADEAEVVDLASVSGGAAGLAAPTARRMQVSSPSGRGHRVGAVRHQQARGRVGGTGAARDQEPGAVAPEAALTQVADEAGLLRWAVAALPYRNTLSDEARGALDAAFLARAEAIEADP